MKTDAELKYRPDLKIARMPKIKKCQFAARGRWMQHNYYETRHLVQVKNLKNRHFAIWKIEI